jgi:hypothetical protein
VANTPVLHYSFARRVAFISRRVVAVSVPLPAPSIAVSINGEPTLSVLTKLFRPVGQTEFELIRASGFREFPPRLPEQPYFYPVLNLEYATQIASGLERERCAIGQRRVCAQVPG